MLRIALFARTASSVASRAASSWPGVRSAGIGGSGLVSWSKSASVRNPKLVAASMACMRRWVAKNSFALASTSGVQGTAANSAVPWTIARSLSTTSRPRTSPSSCRSWSSLRDPASAGTACSARTARVPSASAFNCCSTSSGIRPSTESAPRRSAAVRLGPRWSARSRRSGRLARRTRASAGTGGPA